MKKTALVNIGILLVINNENPVEHLITNLVNYEYRYQQNFILQFLVGAYTVYEEKLEVQFFIWIYNF